MCTWRAPADVVIVAIDDASFRELQLQWPWPRAVHADLVDALAEMGASVIAFDVLFLEPSRFGPEDDARLAEAAARAGNVIFGHKLTHIVDQQFRTSALDKPVPPLAAAAAHLGLSMDVLAFDAEAVAARGSGALTVGGREIGLLPAGPFAGTYVINFLGGAHTVRTIPYYQVLDRTAPREWIEGRIVLVGAVTPDLEDMFATPFSTWGSCPASRCTPTRS